MGGFSFIADVAKYGRTYNRPMELLSLPGTAKPSVGSNSQSVSINENVFQSFNSYAKAVLGNKSVDMSGKYGTSNAGAESVGVSDCNKINVGGVGLVGIRPLWKQVERVKIQRAFKGDIFGVQDRFIRRFGWSVGGSMVFMDMVSDGPWFMGSAHIESMEGQFRGSNPLENGKDAEVVLVWDESWENGGCILMSIVVIRVPKNVNNDLVPAF
ncbi:hypothetical protein Tco_1039374 [Tanacetum coccineum]